MSKVIGIDIGGTFIKYALVREDLTLEKEGKKPTPNTMEAFIASLLEVIEELNEGVDGVAISLPGKINNQAGFVYHGGLIPYLKMQALGPTLEEACNLPVRLINDGDAAALAEGKYGNLRGLNCGAAMVLGTGVGGGIVVKGELLANHHFSPEGMQEILRNHEDLAANYQELPLLERAALTISLYTKGATSMLFNAGSAVNFVDRASQELGLDQPDGVKVFQVLEQKESAELQVLFEEYCREIALLILNIEGIFKLEKLVIGGGISAQDLLLEEINRQYLLLLQEEVSFKDQGDHLQIDRCYFANQANIIGAYSNFLSLLDQENQTSESETGFFASLFNFMANKDQEESQ